MDEEELCVWLAGVPWQPEAGSRGQGDTGGVTPQPSQVTGGTPELTVGAWEVAGWSTEQCCKTMFSKGG